MCSCAQLSSGIWHAECWNTLPSDCLNAVSCTVVWDMMLRVLTTCSVHVHMRLFLSLAFSLPYVTHLFPCLCCP